MARRVLSGLALALLALVFGVGGCSVVINTDDLTCFPDPKLGTTCGVCSTSKYVCGSNGPVCEKLVDGVRSEHVLDSTGAVTRSLDRVDAYAFAWQQDVLWGVTTTVTIYGSLQDYEQHCNAQDPICDCTNGTPCTIPHAELDTGTDIIKVTLNQGTPDKPGGEVAEATYDLAKINDICDQNNCTNEGEWIHFALPDTTAFDRFHAFYATIETASSHYQIFFDATPSGVMGPPLWHKNPLDASSTWQQSTDTMMATVFEVACAR